ncbi:MAG: alkaline phosphatase [Glaciihabitans sp.]|nr:alkaline phosphatase [Glaciihabitans sp.]
MMFQHTRSRYGRGATASVALTALLAGGLLSIPTVASADTGELGGNGAAARNTEDKTASIRESIVDGPAKNVILLIGDGMGDSEITIARNYQYGAAGELPGIDALPLTGQYTTYSLHNEGEDKGLPDYVPDSAATGSAWATGTKTYDGAISVDTDGTPQATLLELAKANGLKTGNVSTAEIQDATPAVQVAHVAARGCYGPEDLEDCGDDALINGGLGSISEQLLGTRPDVTIGGGSASFEQTAAAGAWEGETLFDQAADRGYQVAGDAASLAAVTEADQSAPLLSLLTEGNFPTRYAPTVATVGGGELEPTTCQPNTERLSSDLSLASLTNKAIDLLDTGDDGFFLQVEGASIDKRDHGADACGQIGETIDLDEAVQAALEFAKADGNTLVIVTADHAHTSQIVDSTPLTTLSTALTTADGTTMRVAYGTNSEVDGSQQHTGAQLRIAGYGPGAANVVGLTDQSDNFFTMANALELNRDVSTFSADAAVELSTDEVKPGGEITVSASGFEGDRQLGGEVESGEVTPSTIDVINGDASYTLTAPEESGEHTVTVTGAQTGAEVVATFTVSEGAVVAPVPSTDPTADPTNAPTAEPTSGAGAGGGSDTPPAASNTAAMNLAKTGVVVAPFVGLGAGLIAFGAILLARRRRLHDENHAA